MKLNNKIVYIIISLVLLFCFLGVIFYEFDFYKIESDEITQSLCFKLNNPLGSWNCASGYSYLIESSYDYCSEPYEKIEEVIGDLPFMSWTEKSTIVKCYKKKYGLFLKK